MLAFWWFAVFARYRIAGNFSGYKLSRIKGEASFRDSYFHDQDGVTRTILWCMAAMAWACPLKITFEPDF